MRPNPQFPADLVTFTEEILSRKLNFLFSVKHNSSFLLTTHSILKLMNHDEYWQKLLKKNIEKS